MSKSFLGSSTHIFCSTETRTYMEAEKMEGTIERPTRGMQSEPRGIASVWFRTASEGRQVSLCSERPLGTEDSESYITVLAR